MNTPINNFMKKKLKKYYDEELLKSDDDNEMIEKDIEEISPPGREKQVKKLKKVFKGKDKAIPYKIAWSQHKKSENNIPKLFDLLEYNDQVAMNPDIFVFNPDHYGNIKNAYKDFYRLNRDVSRKKTTDIRTIKSFIKNVYQGGDNSISIKKFIEFLVKKGIYVVKDRKENRISNLEKF